MTTSIRTADPAAAGLARLALHQWLSPAFPTGAFAFSQGLETRIADGAVRKATDLRLWLDAMLAHGPARQDAVLLAIGLRPDADLDALSAQARALATSAERLEETVAQGAAFARAAAAATGRALPPRPLPLAVAQTARTLPLPPAEIVAAFLLAWATNLVAIGVRHIPLGQSAGQALLAALLPAIARTARAAARADPADLCTAVPAADLAAMEHETLPMRIFRT
ncbi:MAG: urease accessory protein UreF [Gemmobacter sp.]